MKQVLLLGAGHAQLSVLSALAQQRMPSADVLLRVAGYTRQIYSGMVPGLIAGRYAEDDCAIDVVPLAAAAGVHLRIGQAAVARRRGAQGARWPMARSSTTTC